MFSMPCLIALFIDREAGEIIRLVASVCLCACLFVCLSVCPSPPETQIRYTLKNIIECSCQGAVKLVVLSNLLLFLQVAHLRSIMLLI